LVVKALLWVIELSGEPVLVFQQHKARDDTGQLPIDQVLAMQSGCSMGIIASF
jgi:hypothetical protein